MKAPRPGPHVAAVGIMDAVPAPDPIPPETLDRIRESFMTSPFNRLVGVEFGSYHDDGVTLELPLEPHHQNGAGVVHGGVALTLADAALGFAVARAAGKRCTTVEIKINYLRPAIEGRLQARSRIIRAGRRLVVARAEVDCDGRQVAEVLSTFAVLD